MIEWLKLFFRGIEDEMPFRFFSLPHVLAMLIGILGVLWIVRHQKELSQSARGPKLIKLLAIVLLAVQVIKYAWDIGSGHFNLDIGLPLYPCRIAIWLLLLSTLCNVKSTWPLAFVWGILGALIATIIADPYPFLWPHFTNLEFFITHIGMGWLILLEIVVKKPVFDNRQLRHLVAQTNLFLLLSWTTNILLAKLGYEVNYAYLFAAPEFLTGVFPPGLPFTLLMVVAYNLLVYTAYLLAKTVTTRYYALDRSADSFAA